MGGDTDFPFSSALRHGLRARTQQQLGEHLSSSRVNPRHPSPCSAAPVFDGARLSSLTRCRSVDRSHYSWTLVLTAVWLGQVPGLAGLTLMGSRLRRVLRA